MADIIKLLPDSVANQIAAGEVVQRPASALKELLENAIDAGSTSIQVIIKDAGKTLIQVIDNGCGMSETDARLSFERHSTSKIQDANDLFAIRTMGFRGEALASIAAIAQVEMKSKKVEEELGTLIEVEGSKVKKQEPVACANGTSVSVKNLFFNVPARRNFLKSDPAETRHLLEEFQRIAIINPDIAFTFHHNNKLIFQLPVSNQKTRIVNIMGTSYSERLVPVEEKTDIVSISGFIGKPQFARKTRGEQYFYTNKRYTKHPYFHHALEQAYQELIPENTYPSYFINFDIDPEHIDVNIHPTKTEINFQNQQVVYAILKSAVKKALGTHSLTPTIDFETEKSIDIGPPDPERTIEQPKIKINPDYNPFDSKPRAPGSKPEDVPWEAFYGGDKDTANIGQDETHQTIIDPGWAENEKEEAVDCIQFNKQYILSRMKTGILLVNQHLAHQRILYERFLYNQDNDGAGSQQLLYPQTIHLSAENSQIISEIAEKVKDLGLDISEFGKNTFIINGVPAGLEDKDLGQLIDSMLENYKTNASDLTQDIKINLATSLARSTAVKPGKVLTSAEMNNLIDELFACKAPDMAPDGKKTYIILGVEEIESKFKSKS